MIKIDPDKKKVTVTSIAVVIPSLGSTIVMTISEAKEMYHALREVFGTRDPITITTPWVETPKVYCSDDGVVTMRVNP